VELVCGARNIPVEGVTGIWLVISLGRGGGAVALCVGAFDMDGAAYSSL
jgi:hypothetical protein